MRDELSRRDVLRMGAVAAGGAAAAGVLTACGGSGVPNKGGSSGGSGGNLVFLSDQLSTTEETAAMRTQILSGFSGGGVSFTSFASATPFIDNVVAQAKAGVGKVDLIGGLQGDFVSLAAQIPLRDMSDMVSGLSGQFRRRTWSWRRSRAPTGSCPGSPRRISWWRTRRPCSTCRPART